MKIISLEINKTEVISLELNSNFEMFIEPRLFYKKRIWDEDTDCGLKRDYLIRNGFEIQIE